MFHTEYRGSVAILYMRHGKANAMDLEFCEALPERLKELQHSSTRAVVLTGEGRIFSAGVDLLQVLDGGAEYVALFLPALTRALEALFAYPGPLVAAVNGHAIAGGCVMAAAADHRVMVDQAGRIGVPELLVGVPFPAAALEIMRFAAAPEHLQAILYGGKTYAPEEARDRGLVDAVTPADRLLDEALAVAESLAALPPAAFALTKQQVRGPALKRLREGGATYDAAVREVWTRPATLAIIRNYVDRTFRRSSA